MAETEGLILDEWWARVIELQIVVNEIVNPEKVRVELIKDAKRILRDLKELLVKESGKVEVDVPEEFKCPLSRKLMIDPVILVNGETFERENIQTWLNIGNKRCPVTNQVLPDTALIPNTSIRQIISIWCERNNVELRDHVKDVEDVDVSNADIGRWNILLNILSSSSSDISDKIGASRELRILTEKVPHFSYLIDRFSDPVIPRLLGPLAQGRVDAHPDLQGNLIATLYNISSVSMLNKKLVCETPLAVSVLIQSLIEGEMKTRTKAATTILALSSLVQTREIIGGSGALPPLIELLRTGDALAVKEAAQAVSKLCLDEENRKIAIASGAVSALMSSIMMEDLPVDDILGALACLLDDNWKAAVELQKTPNGVVSRLFRIAEKSEDESVKDNCTVILHSFCFYDKAKIPVIRREEDNNHMLGSIVNSGTYKALKKAKQILSMISKGKAICIQINEVD